MKIDWYNNIYEEIIKEWRIFVVENEDEDEDEDDILENFKESNFNISFNLEDYNAIDVLEIQKYLIDNGVNYQYVFDILEIEKYVVEKVLDEFDG
jgi:hypothetical protein